MGCSVRPLQGLGIKALVYEFLVLRIGESLFLQGVDNTYSTILPNSASKRYNGGIGIIVPLQKQRLTDFEH